MMEKLTREQRLAVKRIYDRGPLVPNETPYGKIQAVWPRDGLWYPHYMTYREFRKTVQHGYDCAMVFWGTMWLGIEKDGYTHS